MLQETTDSTLWVLRKNVSKDYQKQTTKYETCNSISKVKGNDGCFNVIIPFTGF